LRVGTHLDKCNDYGPFINETEANKFKSSLASQTTANVQQFTASLQDKANTAISAPTIITNVQPSTEFYQSELNGPYIIVTSFRTVKESIELLNTSRFGSGVSLWSENISLGTHCFLFYFQKNYKKIFDLSYGSCLQSAGWYCLD